ncbi:hypothetical protein ACWD7Y_04090 [Streptomyces drozdowiczii]
MKIPEVSGLSGRQAPMVEEQVPGWHMAVLDAVREMEKSARESALLAIGATSRRLSDVLGVTETTALRYLRDVIASGKLVEISHAGRRLLFPWPAELQDPPERWATGEVKRGTFRMTAHREVGPAMSKIRFVFTPERLKQVMDQAVAEEAAKAAKKEHEAEERRAKWDAEAAEERAVFEKHYPALAGLLARLHEQVNDPGDSLGGVRLHAKEHPQVGVLARVSIEVREEQFEALEKILGKALGGDT